MFSRSVALFILLFGVALVLAAVYWRGSDLNSWCTIRSFECGLTANFIIGLFLLLPGVLVVGQGLYKKVEEFIGLPESLERVHPGISEAHQKVSTCNMQIAVLASQDPKLLPIQSELLDVTDLLLKSKDEITELRGGLKFLKKAGEKIP